MLYKLFIIDFSIILVLGGEPNIYKAYYACIDD